MSFNLRFAQASPPLHSFPHRQPTSSTQVASQFSGFFSLKITLLVELHLGGFGRTSYNVPPPPPGLELFLFYRWPFHWLNNKNNVMNIAPAS